MSDEPISESAKAVQEVAKTTDSAIKATEKLGGFVSRIVGEPIDTVVSILSDRLKYMRWERQVRLTERAKEFVREKNIKGELKVVPPKIALPIIENASLEENDELQDLWARLIASAVDPNYNGIIRAAFIDIIKQLEVNDVHILNYVYKRFELSNVLYEKQMNFLQQYYVKGSFYTTMADITENTEIDNENVYRESIDNLIRAGCVTFYVEDKEVITRDENRLGYLNDEDRRLIQNVFSYNHSYDKICITELGVSFVEACIKPIKDDFDSSSK